MTYNGLPIFVVDLNDNTIFNNISIVDYPAIECDFIKLSKETEIKFKVNEEKRTISGPVLIPNKPIYRRDDDGNEFYIKFEADTIRMFAEKFFRDGRQNEGNVEHSFGVNGITFYESYLLNKERGIAPKEFEDLPDGTWMVSAKVENDDVWKLVTDGTLRGFSVDIFTRISEPKTEIDNLKDLIDYLKNK